MGYRRRFSSKSFPFHMQSVNILVNVTKIEVFPRTI